MNEWMVHLYIALLCIVVHPRRFTIMGGGGGGGGVSPQPPAVCSIHLNNATAATVQRCQCAQHTPATGGEERESLSQSSGWGLLEGHDWQGPVERIWPGRRGYTPTLYEECHGIFMTTESQDLGLTSRTERQSFWQYSVPVTGALGPTQTAGWAPPAVLTNTSSSSNLVFPGGFPSRYWPGSTLLSFSGQLVLGCMVIWLQVRLSLCILCIAVLYVMFYFR